MNIREKLVIGDEEFLVVDRVESSGKRRYRKLKQVSTGEEFDGVEIGDKHYYGVGYPNFKVALKIIDNDLEESLNDSKINVEYKFMEDLEESIQYELIELDGLDFPIDMGLVVNSGQKDKTLDFFKALASGKYLEPRLTNYGNGSIYSKPILDRELILEHSNGCFIQTIDMPTYMAIVEGLTLSALLYGNKYETYAKYIQIFKDSNIGEDELSKLRKAVNQNLESAILIELTKRLYEVRFKGVVERINKVDTFGNEFIQEMFFTPDEGFIINIYDKVTKVNALAFGDELRSIIYNEFLEI